MTSEDLDIPWIKCDSCPAQSKYIARGTTGELYFCGHHRNEFSETLDKWAYEIVEYNKTEEVPQLQEERI